MLDAKDRVKDIGNNIIQTLPPHYDLAGYIHRSTPSIGIALLHSSYGSVDKIFKQADIAMYQSKSAGRGCLNIFDPEPTMNVLFR
jgi:predicted signal transduction protein with EAL and GGDEF domain